MALSSQAVEPPSNPGRFIPKQKYTTEFKEQAVKRADEVGSIARVAEELGLVEQTLRNGVKAAKAGKLSLAGAKQITAEQMELSRLRAQVARLEMELEITKKAAAYFAKELL
ncbi:transposase [Plasticicumulans lactativorans]|uniref:Transposase n=1 Tax=Plasticicumulans lactativorans TaxID=1133106 RepID=A0A4R2LC90_9GAMM|nr:transposase [Plasticicumulans lactativorans]